MLTYNNVRKQVNKYLSEGAVSDDQINDYLNMAFKEASRYCPMPNCGKKFRNSRGVRIHISRMHMLSNDKLVKEVVDRLKRD